MDIDLEKLTYYVNSLENCGKQLAKSVDEMDRSRGKTRDDLFSLLEALGDLRSTMDNVIDQMHAVWEGFLQVADQCCSMANCPRNVLDIFVSAFDRMGYKAYGLPGNVVEDIGSVEIVAKHDEATQAAGTVLQTLQVGLRRKDGSIARYPKVTVSG
jgi:hypothetical protein